MNLLPLLNRLTKRLLRAELVSLDEMWGYRLAQSVFDQWRRSSQLWERYAREMQARHPEEESFESWFWKQPYARTRNPELSFPPPVSPENPATCDEKR